MKKGNCRSGCSYPGKLFPFNSRSLREEPEAAWRDAQYAAHAAHAVDPSVLDAGPTPGWLADTDGCSRTWMMTASVNA